MNVGSTMLSLDYSDPELLYYAALSLGLQENSHGPTCDRIYSSEVPIHQQLSSFHHTQCPAHSQSFYSVETEMVECASNSYSTEFTIQHSTQSNNTLKKQPTPPKRANEARCSQVEWVWHDYARQKSTEIKLVETKNIYQKKKQPYDQMVMKLSYKN